MSAFGSIFPKQDFIKSFLYKSNYVSLISAKIRIEGGYCVVRVRFLAAFCSLIGMLLQAFRRTPQKLRVTVERITLRLPKQQLELIDELVSAGEFPSKSEAIRAAVRDLVDTRYDKLLTRKERITHAI